MIALVIAVVASFAVVANAGGIPVGCGHGPAVVPAGPTLLVGASDKVGPDGASRPSEIVTGRGAIGPSGEYNAQGHTGVWDDSSAALVGHGTAYGGHGAAWGAPLIGLAGHGAAYGGYDAGWGAAAAAWAGHGGAWGAPLVALAGRGAAYSGYDAGWGAPAAAWAGHGGAWGANVAHEAPVLIKKSAVALAPTAHGNEHAW